MLGCDILYGVDQLVLCCLYVCYSNRNVTHERKDKKKQNKINTMEGTKKNETPQAEQVFCSVRSVELSIV